MCQYKSATRAGIIALHVEGAFWLAFFTVIGLPEILSKTAASVLPGAVDRPEASRTNRPYLSG
jgi:hypothetical protein